MLKLKKIVFAILFVASVAAFVPSEAKADGPLRRWWRNITGRNNNCCQQPAGLQPYAVAPTQNVTANYQTPYNLQPGQCMTTCQQTCSRTVVNYVPETAYRTVYNRVPVTQYRPVTNSDPCTGCTVTCMKPCTTYTYQVQRVPYTTYRPVYRQETYKVPVTTISNDCATGNCATGNCGVVNNGCSTCGPGVGVPVQNFAPSTQPTPATVPQPITNYSYEPTTVSPSGEYRTSVPADQTPSLNLGDLPNPQSSQRPTFSPYNPSSPSPTYKASSPTPVYQQLNQPSVIQYNDGRTANMTPIRRDWQYSPIRTASSRQDTFYASQPTNASSSRWVED